MANPSSRALQTVAGGHVQDTIWATTQPPVDSSRSKQQQQQSRHQSLEPLPQEESSRGSDRAQQQQQQRRVCVACRRRKVGCNKQQPCQNCKKANAECIYLPEETQSSRQQAIGNARIWEQLRRLEPMFQTLADRMEQSGGGAEDPIIISSKSAAVNPGGARGQVNDEDPSNHEVQQAGQTSRSPPPAPPFPQTSHSIDGTSYVHTMIPEDEMEPLRMNYMANQPRHALAPPEEPPQRKTPSPTGGVASINSADTPFGSTSGNESTSTAWSPYGATAGQLVKDDGRHRYVTGRFWEVLHHRNEDESSQDAFSDISDYDDYSPPPSPGPPSQYSLIFNMGGQDRARDSLHPPVARRQLLFQIFKDNVHPLVSVLHLPSMDPVITDALRNVDSVPPAVEALLFVIYFGAVSSLPAETCEEQFGGKQTYLQSHFRRASEAAFSKARLMETDNILVLQAFLIFLVVLRPYDPTSSWNLTGLAIRLAQNIGLHRDGSQLNLSPFDAEMRRRLWWAFCVLDAPAAEDHLCTPPTLELSSSDANLPLNVNDADLHPDMDKPPTPRIGSTDTCLHVARSWVSNIWRTIMDTRRVDIDTGKSFRAMTIAEKECWVDKQHKMVLSRFFGNKPPDTPLHHLTSSVIVTIFCGLRLFIYNPLHSDIEISDDQRKHIFNCAVECMSHSYRMRTDPRFSQWGWLLKTYHEWYAFAVVLSELCNRPLEKEAQRAWRVVERSAVLRLDTSTRYHRVHQWRSVMKTIEKARRRRRKFMARRQSMNSRRDSYSVHSDRGRMQNMPNQRAPHPGHSNGNELLSMQQDSGGKVMSGRDLIHHHVGATLGESTQIYSPPGSLDPMAMDSSQFLDPTLFSSSQFDNLFALMNAGADVGPGGCES